MHRCKLGVVPEPERHFWDSPTLARKDYLLLHLSIFGEIQEFGPWTRQSGSQSLSLETLLQSPGVSCSMPLGNCIFLQESAFFLCRKRHLSTKSHCPAVCSGGLRIAKGSLLWMRLRLRLLMSMRPEQSRVTFLQTLRLRLAIAKSLVILIPRCLGARDSNHDPLANRIASESNRAV